MSTLTRRERDKQALRRLILDKAREIFVRDGYEQFNMRRLAAEIEYSPGTLYLHFADKAELFECLVGESFARLRQHLAKLGRVPGGDPIAALKASLRVYVEFGLKHPNDYRFAFVFHRPLAESPYKIDPSYDELQRLVRACVTQDRFTTDDVKLASQAIWVSVHGLISLLIQRPGFPWVAKNKLIAQVIDSAVGGLLKQGES